MKLVFNSSKGPALCIGWCPDKEGKPQAILIYENGSVGYEGITSLRPLNVKAKDVRRLTKLAQHHSGTVHLDG